MRFLLTELENRNIKVDKNGIVVCRYIDLTLEESLILTKQAEEIKKLTYGFKVIKNNESIYFRFLNETTKKKDTAESFIKKNWEV